MQISGSLQMFNQKAGNTPVNTGHLCQLCFKANPPGRNPNTFALQCDKCGKFNHIVCFNKENKTKKNRKTINFICSPCRLIPDLSSSQKIAEHCSSPPPAIVSGSFPRAPPGYPFTSFKTPERNQSAEQYKIAVSQPTGNVHPSSSTEPPGFHPAGTFQSQQPFNVHQSLNHIKDSTVQHSPRNLQPQSSSFHPSGSTESPCFHPSAQQIRNHHPLGLTESQMFHPADKSVPQQREVDTDGTNIHPSDTLQSQHLVHAHQSGNSHLNPSVGHPQEILPSPSTDMSISSLHPSGTLQSLNLNSSVNSNNDPATSQTSVAAFLSPGRLES